MIALLKAISMENFSVISSGYIKPKIASAIVDFVGGWWRREKKSVAVVSRTIQAVLLLLVRYQSLLPMTTPFPVVFAFIEALQNSFWNLILFLIKSSSAKAAFIVNPKDYLTQTVFCHYWSLLHFYLNS